MLVDVSYRSPYSWPRLYRGAPGMVEDSGVEALELTARFGDNVGPAKPIRPLRSSPKSGHIPWHEHPHP